MKAINNQSRFNLVNFLKADAGFYLLEPVTNEDDTIGAFKHCIIGWAVDHDERHSVVVTYPITLEAMSTENLPILRPDGIVESPHDTYWNTLEEWIADQNKNGAANV